MSKPTITKADRDAATEIGLNALRWTPKQAEATLAGYGDQYPLVQAFAAHREAAEQRGREAERAEVVAEIRADNLTCDCFAREPGECACGGWDEYKTKPLPVIADAIEARQHRSERMQAAIHNLNPATIAKEAE